MRVCVCAHARVCVGHYPVSSIMQPIHVSTQPHSSAAEREERAEQCRDRREKKKQDELVNMRIVIAGWVFKHFQCIKQKHSFTSIAEKCLCFIKRHSPALYNLFFFSSYSIRYLEFSGLNQLLEDAFLLK